MATTHPTLTRLAQRIADSANDYRNTSPDIDLLRKYDEEAEQCGVSREEHDRILVEVRENLAFATGITEQFEIASRMGW